VTPDRKGGMGEQLGERVAVVETEIETLKEEVNERLRPLAHKAASVANEANLRALQIEKAQAIMSDKVLPEFAETLEALAGKVSDIRDKVLTRNTDVGWFMRIFSFALRDLATPMILLWVAYEMSKQ
jgi:hypothetical protein